MKESIYKLVYDIQQQKGGESLEYILKQFAPLLKRSAIRLGKDEKWTTEDALSELQIFFIELLYSIPLSSMHSQTDASFVVYFQKSIERRVFLLQKKDSQYNCILLNDLSEGESHYCKYNIFSVNDHSALLLEDISKCLTPIEYITIVDLYFKEMSIAEIACRRKISRQAVNRTKLNALKKLRKFFS